MLHELACQVHVRCLRILRSETLRRPSSAQTGFADYAQGMLYHSWLTTPRKHVHSAHPRLCFPQGPGEHLMNLFSFLLPHTRVPGAPHNSEALVRHDCVSRCECSDLQNLCDHAGHTKACHPSQKP